MKRSIGSCAAMFICLMSPSLSLAEGLNLPKFEGGNVRVKVSRAIASDIFQYDYRIENLGGSTLKIKALYVDVRSDPSRMILSREGLTNAKGYHEHTSALNMEKVGPENHVGVGFLSLPPNWLTSLTMAPSARWGSKEVSRVVAGQTVSGLVLASKGLPGIRTAELEPDLWDYQPSVEGLVRMGLTIDDFSKAVEESVQRLKSVGPTAPPKIFDPVKYVEYMQSLRSQSFELHWIKDSYTASEIDGKLSVISSQLSAITDQKIPLSKGTKILELGAQFLQFVESNSCKEFECSESRPLTAESYALLFYNMEYFLTQVRKACEQPAQLPPPIPSPAPKRKK